MKTYRWKYAAMSVHRKTNAHDLVEGHVTTGYQHEDAARHEVRRLFEGTDYLVRGVVVELIIR